MCPRSFFFRLRQFCPGPGSSHCRTRAPYCLMSMYIFNLSFPLKLRLVCICEICTVIRCFQAKILSPYFIVVTPLSACTSMSRNRVRVIARQHRRYDRQRLKSVRDDFPFPYIYITIVDRTRPTYISRDSSSLYLTLYLVSSSVFPLSLVIRTSLSLLLTKRQRHLHKWIRGVKAKGWPVVGLGRVKILNP